MAKLEPHPLMRTIVDHPDADLPRLVYADWLDEQGDPRMAMRAEYIRASIELETLPVRSAAWNALHDCQLGRLAVNYVAAVIDPPMPELGRESLTCRRGFPERLHTNLKRFAQGEAEVLELAPITSIVFVNSIDPRGDARHAAAAFARPEIARLRTIFIVAPLDAAAFAALVANPHATGVRELDFQLSGSFTDDAAAALASGAARFKELTKLEIWGGRASSAAHAQLRAAFGSRATINGRPA